MTEEHFFQVTAVLGCAGCTLQVYFFFFFSRFRVFNSAAFSGHSGGLDRSLPVCVDRLVPKPWGQSLGT